MERIEITLYPNQAEEVEKILEEFQVPYTKTPAESYKIQCVHYVIFSPSEIAATLIDILAHKFDTNQRINVITHYKPEATISEYLRKFEAFLKEDSSIQASAKKADIDIIAGFKSVKDKRKRKKNYHAYLSYSAPHCGG